MITPQEIAVIKKMFRKTRAKTDPLVEAKRMPGAHPKVAEMIAGQNVLRDCMSVVMNECMPIDKSFVAEMALRLASYAVSVAPIEDQAAIAVLVGKSFPDMHMSRMRQGIGIEAEWVTDGVQHTNMPTKSNTN